MGITKSEAMLQLGWDASIIEGLTRTYSALTHSITYNADIQLPTERRPGEIGTLAVTLMHPQMQARLKQMKERSVPTLESLSDFIICQPGMELMLNRISYDFVLSDGDLPADYQSLRSKPLKDISAADIRNLAQGPRSFRAARFAEVVSIYLSILENTTTFRKSFSLPRKSAVSLGGSLEDFKRQNELMTKLREKMSDRDINAELQKLVDSVSSLSGNTPK